MTTMMRCTILSDKTMISERLQDNFKSSFLLHGFLSIFLSSVDFEGECSKE
jgi:hypothetical protein